MRIMYQTVIRCRDPQERLDVLLRWTSSSIKSIPGKVRAQTCSEDGEVLSLVILTVSDWKTSGYFLGPDYCEERMPTHIRTELMGQKTEPLHPLSLLEAPSRPMFFLFISHNIIVASRISWPDFRNAINAQAFGGAVREQTV